MDGVPILELMKEIVHHVGSFLYSRVLAGGAVRTHLFTPPLLLLTVEGYSKDVLSASGLNVNF